MPRYKDEPPAVRVYTVCDESRYLIVRNVPALGCGDDLLKLFASYGDIEECKPMDAEDCEAYTDVYWIKFRLVSCARFAKRKLDEFVFLGNRLKVSYAPEFESLSETKDKLEGRRKEVLARLNRKFSYIVKTSLINSICCTYNGEVASIGIELCDDMVVIVLASAGRPKGPYAHKPAAQDRAPLLAASSQTNCISQGANSNPWGDTRELADIPHNNDPSVSRVSSDKDYFPSQSMNQTVKFVREKLSRIQSSSEHLEGGPASKKTRIDNRRRI